MSFLLGIFGCIVSHVLCGAVLFINKWYLLWQSPSETAAIAITDIANVEDESFYFTPYMITFHVLYYRSSFDTLLKKEKS